MPGCADPGTWGTQCGRGCSRPFWAQGVVLYSLNLVKRAVPADAVRHVNSRLSQVCAGQPLGHWASLWQTRDLYGGGKGGLGEVSDLLEVTR